MPRFPAAIDQGLRQADLILDHVRDGIILLDMQGRVQWMNPACEQMLGWPLPEALGKTPQSLLTPPESRGMDGAGGQFRYDLSRSIFRRFHIAHQVRPDGHRFWNQLSHSVIDLGAGDDQKMIVVTCRDITEQIKTEQALHRTKDNLEHAALHDDLTGLGNRKKLSDFLKRQRVQTALAQGRIGVLQMDLDKFKDINDTLGHGAGDATLIHVAGALHACARPGDLACRIGGDEFLLICLDIASRAALIQRGRQILQAVGMPLIWQDQSVQVRMSIGASLPIQGHVSGAMLIQQADQALYSAKHAGRGQMVVYDDRMGDAHRAARHLMRDLRRAVDEDQFTVHLHPQIDLADGRVSGCEALIRWLHPTRGLLGPGDFLEAAQQAHLLARLDQLSMAHALAALARLQEAGFGDMRMSINVSSPILTDTDYPGFLDWALQSRGLRHDSVCVEIRETTLREDGGSDIMTAVTRLRRMGVRVALDDFGTGYAGLAHMSAFEIDAIKLDRAMVHQLDSDPRSRVIVRTVIRLCALLGIDMVAEGVETQAQLDILRRAKCPVVQGFGLARPMPPEALIAWLRARPAPRQPPVIMQAPDTRDIAARHM